MDRIRFMLYGVIVGFIFMAAGVPDLEILEDLSGGLNDIMDFVGFVSVLVFGIPLLIHSYKALLRK